MKSVLYRAMYSGYIKTTMRRHLPKPIRQQNRDGNQAHNLKHAQNIQLLVGAYRGSKNRRMTPLAQDNAYKLYLKHYI